MNNAQKRNYIILGLVGVLVVGFLYYQSLRNHLITLDESIDSSWAQVENQLQRRYDLVPNLVRAVKGYALHEQELFTNIAASRAKLAGANSRSQKLDVSNQMEGYLSRLLVVVERYPNLKANENFNRLMDELSGSENRLSVERRRYNENVKLYNRTIRTFPYRYVAEWNDFKKTDYFQIENEATKTPVVEFD
ncbi:MAG: LemA family protein [bacterium]|nr:LemA family protein [bacterium]